MNRTIEPVYIAEMNLSELNITPHEDDILRTQEVGIENTHESSIRINEIEELVRMAEIDLRGVSIDPLEDNIARTQEVLRECNCRKMNECPLENKCLTKNVVYMATVESEGTEYKYIGATGGEFKSRWRNHMLSFRRINMRHCTSLANTVHTIKEITVA